GPHRRLLRPPASAQGPQLRPQDHAHLPLYLPRALRPRHQRDRPRNPGRTPHRLRPPAPLRRLRARRRHPRRPRRSPRLLLPVAGPGTIAIEAIPNAPRNQVAGWLGAALKTKAHAPALEGRATAELRDFLADALGLPRR